MEVEVKRLTLRALEASGEGQALFSVWQSPDSDGDITERGFFGNGQEVFMLPHHLWSSGNPPLGKGTIVEESQGAVYYFRMNLQTDQGRNWHQHLLFDLREGQQPQQAWSYGFKVKEGGSTPRGHTRGRILHAVKSTGEPGAIVVEVSPVTAASQPLGRTLAAKTDGAPLTRAQSADAHRIKRSLDRMLAERWRDEQLQAKHLRLAFLQRQIAMSHGRIV